MTDLIFLAGTATREGESLIMQYVVVAAIILGALLWSGIKIFSLKKKGGVCAGCELAKQCSPEKRKEHSLLYEKKKQQKDGEGVKDTDRCHDSN